MSKEKEKSFNNADAESILYFAQDIYSTANGICYLTDSILTQFDFEENGRGTALTEQAVKEITGFISLIKSACKGIKKDAGKVFYILDEDAPEEELLDN